MLLEGDLLLGVKAFGGRGEEECDKELHHLSASDRARFLIDEACRGVSD